MTQHNKLSFRLHANTFVKIFEVMVSEASSSTSMTPEAAYLGKTFFSLGPRMQIQGISSSHLARRAPLFGVASNTGTCVSLEGTVHMATVTSHGTEN